MFRSDTEVPQLTVKKFRRQAVQKFERQNQGQISLARYGRKLAVDGVNTMTQL